jgi:hypothetical protein
VDKTIYLKDKRYISAILAAEMTGYTSDYIGQLCRAKKIDANLVGKSWYVLEDEILKHKERNLIVHKKTLKTRKLKKNGSSNIKFERHLFSLTEPLGKKKTKILYYKDNKELFPVLKKRFSADSIKYIAMDSVKKALAKTKRKKSGFEKFVVWASAVLISVSLFGTLILKNDNSVKLADIHFKESVRQEISFLYKPYSNNSQNNFAGSQLASLAIVLTDKTGSFSRWIGDFTYKIVKPYCQ